MGTVSFKFVINDLKLGAINKVAEFIDDPIFKIFRVDKIKVNYLTAATLYRSTWEYVPVK